jgi:hypothetical protein
MRKHNIYLKNIKNSLRKSLKIFSTIAVNKNNNYQA